MNNKFFSIAASLNKIFSAFNFTQKSEEKTSPSKWNTNPQEDAELLAIFDEMDLENKSDLLEKHPITPYASSQPITKTDNNKPIQHDLFSSKPLPPPVGQRYVPQPRKNGEEPPLPPRFGEPLDIKPREAGSPPPSLPPRFGEPLDITPREAGSPPPPLPPRFGEDLPLVKKNKKSDDDNSDDSMVQEIKTPTTTEQVNERILEQRRRKAIMEAKEKERLNKVHVHYR